VHCFYFAYTPVIHADFRRRLDPGLNLRQEASGLPRNLPEAMKKPGAGALAGNRFLRSITHLSFSYRPPAIRNSCRLVSRFKGATVGRRQTLREVTEDSPGNRIFGKPSGTPAAGSHSNSMAAGIIIVDPRADYSMKSVGLGDVTSFRHWKRPTATWAFFPELFELRYLDGRPIAPNDCRIARNAAGRGHCPTSKAQSPPAQRENVVRA